MGPKPHPVAKLAVLFDLNAGVAVAAQDHGVVALRPLRLSGGRGAVLLCRLGMREVLPPPPCRLRLEYDGHVVVACISA